MKRHSIALFLSTLALAGGTVACGKSPEPGVQGGNQQPKEKLSPPSKPTPAHEEGGEGGEG